MRTLRPLPKAGAFTCSCASSAAAATFRPIANFDEDLGIGWIPIDSVHSPVKKVNYLVEAARLGQTTDYDKLTIEVWTNGSVTPRDAVSLSAKLVRDHLNIFINLEDGDDDQVETGAEPARVGVTNEHLDKSVEELELSVRSSELASRTRTSAPFASWSARPRPRCSRPRTSGASRSTRSRRS